MKTRDMLKRESLKKDVERKATVKKTGEMLERGSMMEAVKREATSKRGDGEKGQLDEGCEEGSDSATQKETSRDAEKRKVERL